MSKPTDARDICWSCVREPCACVKLPTAKEAREAAQELFEANVEVFEWGTVERATYTTALLSRWPWLRPNPWTKEH